MDQISENDSGIDSLRQHISPFNHVRNVSHTGTNNENENSGAIQQRFKQVTLIDSIYSNMLLTMFNYFELFYSKRYK